MDSAPGLVPVHGDAFDAKQSDLQAEASGVAPELPVASHDSMTRNDDRKGVGAHRLTDGPSSARFAEFVRDVAVRHDTAIRNGHQALVYTALEFGGPGEVERKIETFSLPAEVLAELLKRLGERGVGLCIPVALVDHFGRDWPDAAYPVARDPDGDGSGGFVVQDPRVDRGSAIMGRHQLIFSSLDVPL